VRQPPDESRGRFTGFRARESSVLKKIAVALVLILAAPAGFIASRPSEMRISRSRTIAAPPEVAHAYNNFMAKAVGLFMDMDKLIGADFEKGLASLDAVTAQSRAEGSSSSL
jgi:hypothetical protein